MDATQRQREFALIARRLAVAVCADDAPHRIRHRIRECAETKPRATLAECTLCVSRRGQGDEQTHGGPSQGTTTTDTGTR